MSITLEEVQGLDRADPLAGYHDEFSIADDAIYLDGNSLGALPKRVKKRIQETTEVQWGEDLISSWNKHSWVDMPQQVGEKIAPLIGAKKSGQVVCCDSISVNVFKLLAAAISFNGTTERNCIVSSHDNFPTDLYIAQGLENLLGSKACKFVDVAEDDLIDSIDETTAVIMVTEVNFRTGKVVDIGRLTKKSHDCGALILVDLAHSVGVMPVCLDDWDVDLAVGCTYKYLNGGPGAPAFLYVNERLHNELQQPIAGWFGHRAPFEFNPTYRADSGIKKFLAGTPSIISMAAADSALEVYETVDIQLVRDKSIKMTSLFHDLIKQCGLADSLQLVSPHDALSRGSQLSYAFDLAYELCQALIARRVVADFRAPNFIRFGFAPLYIRFEDVWNSVQLIRHVIESKEYKDPRWAQRNAVT